MLPSTTIPGSLWRASFFEEAPVPCALVSPDDRFLHVNRSYCELTGYAEDELANLRWQDITHPNDVAGDTAGARRILAGDRDEYSMLKRYIRKDEQIIWINLNVRAFRTGKNLHCYAVHAVPVVRSGRTSIRDGGVLEVVPAPLVNWFDLIKRNPWQTATCVLSLLLILGRESLAALITKLITHP